VSFPRAIANTLLLILGTAMLLAGNASAQECIAQGASSLSKDWFWHSFANPWNSQYLDEHVRALKSTLRLGDPAAPLGNKRLICQNSRTGWVYMRKDAPGLYAFATDEFYVRYERSGLCEGVEVFCRGDPLPTDRTTIPPTDLGDYVSDLDDNIKRISSAIGELHQVEEWGGKPPQGCNVVVVSPEYILSPCGLIGKYAEVWLGSDLRYRKTVLSGLSIVERLPGAFLLKHSGAPLTNLWFLSLSRSPPSADDRFMAFNRWFDVLRVRRDCKTEGELPSPSGEKPKLINFTCPGMKSTWSPLWFSTNGTLVGLPSRDGLPQPYRAVPLSALVSASKILSSNVANGPIAGVTGVGTGSEPIKDLCFTVLNPRDPPGQLRALPLYVKIVGNYSDLIEIWEGDGHYYPRQSRLLYLAYTETRDAMGANRGGPLQPERGRLNCGRIGILGDFVYGILGWKADLFHVYAAVRDSQGQITALQQLQFNPHDGGLEAGFLNNEFHLTLGRKGDRHVTFCWKPEFGKWWWSSGDSRHDGFAKCDQEAPVSWSEGGQRSIPLTPLL
jgi:hypothetical protein